jgi:hypothetical protein
MPKKKQHKFTIILLGAVLIIVLGLLSLVAGDQPAQATGTNYYVDATGGDDDNSGTTTVAPWETIAKVNSSSFSPGDSILFKRGETWEEVLIVPSSGSAGGGDITFGAYDSGDDPIIKIPKIGISSGSLWTELDDTDIYYTTLDDPDSVGWLYKSGTRMTAKAVNYGMSAAQVNDPSAFWTTVPGNGAASLECSPALAGSYSMCMWKGSGDYTYVSASIGIEAASTEYILTYGGRSDGDAEGYVRIRYWYNDNYHYLQDNGSWSTTPNNLDDSSWGVQTSDTTWTRKEVTFTSDNYTGLYEIHLGNSTDSTVMLPQYVWYDDTLVYNVKGISGTGDWFAAILMTEGDVGVDRTYPVKLYVKSASGAPTGISYQNQRAAIELGGGGTNTRSYITVEDLELKGAIFQHGEIFQNITIQDCVVDESGTPGQGQQGYGQIAGITLKNSGDGTSNITISSNTITNALGAGIKGWVWTTNNVIQNNTIENFAYGNYPWLGGVYCTNCSNTTVTENLIKTAGDDGIDKEGGVDVHGIWLDGYNDGSSNTVSYNWVEDITGTGLFCESVHESDWGYNLVVDAGIGILVGSPAAEAHNNDFYGNTIVGTQVAGIWLRHQDECTPSCTYTTYVANNIVSPASGFFMAKTIYFEDVLAVDYNLYDSAFGSASDSKWFHHDAAYPGSIPGANNDWCDKTGENPAHSKVDDPDFGAGYVLDSTDSAAYEAGAILGSAYDDGLDPSSNWPNSVSTLDQDLEGSGWEMGAFVYDE